MDRFPSNEFRQPPVPNHELSAAEKKIIKPLLWSNFREEISKINNPNILIIGTDDKATLTKIIYHDLESHNPLITVIEGNKEIIDKAKLSLSENKIEGVKFIQGMFPDKLPPEFDKHDSFHLILGSNLIRHVKSSERKSFILSATDLLYPGAPLGLSSFPVEDIGLFIEFKLRGLQLKTKPLPIPYGSVFIFRKSF